MCGEEGEGDEFSTFTAILVIVAITTVAAVFVTEIVLPAAFKFFM